MKEAEAGFYEDRPLIGTAHRTAFDASVRMTDAFKRAVKVYDLDARLEDIAYAQRSVDVNGRPNYAFGLKPEALERTKLCTFITT